MTAKEKKRKAAMVAVAYHLEQEAANNQSKTLPNAWSVAGKETMMKNRTMVQRHGRVLRNRS